MALTISATAAGNEYSRVRSDCLPLATWVYTSYFVLSISSALLTGTLTESQSPAGVIFVADTPCDANHALIDEVVASEGVAYFST